MDDERKIKKVLGVLIHLSEHRGRNLVSGNLKKSEFFQKKSEELRNILTNYWSRIDVLTTKFSEFQKSIDTNQKNL